MAARILAAGEVVEALRANNLQIASGALNQQPVPMSGAFQLSVETVGRLLDPQQFADIVVKTDAQGRVTRVRDVARVELGARDYSTEIGKHTSELQSLMRISYAVFCLKKKNQNKHNEELYDRKARDK